MLAYLPIDAPSAVDALLTDLADTLVSEGWVLAGAVQVNDQREDGKRSQMNLKILGTGDVVRISQDLGPLSSGCSLCPAGLEDAVGRAEGRLAEAQLVIVNKFGKTEVDGRGFRPLIGRALADGVPVITAVGPGNMDGFMTFAGDFAEVLAPDQASAIAWVQRVSETPA